MSPAFTCPVAGCELKVHAVSVDVQVLFLQTHNRDAHGAMQAPLEQCDGGETGPRAQKLQRPVIPEDCSEVQWSFFMDKWDDYKGFYKLSTKEEIYSHLRDCYIGALQFKLYEATGGSAKTMEEEDLLREIKRLAVVKVNTAVHVKEVLELRQDPDEPVRQVKAKLQKKSQLKVARTARELKDKFKVSVVEDQTLKGQIGGQEGGALDKIIPKTSVSCIVADCQFRMEQVDEINAKRVLENHVFVVHRQQTQTHLQQRKGKDHRIS